MRTVQDQLTTIKNRSKLNPDEPVRGYANNYDHFTYDEERFKDLHPRVAVLIDESFGMGKIDIIFTTEGIILDKAFTGFNENPDIIPYKKINSDNNKLDIAGESYKNKEINMFALFDLIQELAELSASISSEDTPAGYLSYNEVYMLESGDN